MIYFFICWTGFRVCQEIFYTYFMLFSFIYKWFAIKPFKFRWSWNCHINKRAHSQNVLIQLHKQINRNKIFLETKMRAILLWHRWHREESKNTSEYYFARLPAGRGCTNSSILLAENGRNLMMHRLHLQITGCVKRMDCAELCPLNQNRKLLILRGISTRICT